MLVSRALGEALEHRPAKLQSRKAAKHPAEARLNPKSIPARDLYGCFEEAETLSERSRREVKYVNLRMLQPLAGLWL